jgi:ribosomal protein L16 Arg81 hydroxylase
VSPAPLDRFLSDHWLRRFLFCRGDADRFASFLSWADLNRILAHHWREVSRFRLAFQGRDLDPQRYADLAGTPRVRARDIVDHLRRGATLSFDALDEVHEPLTRVAEAFETTLCGSTKINVYAGWRRQHGLDLHRDNHEVFILQVDGRKRWLLYGESIDGIDTASLDADSMPPPGALLDRVIQPGDLLYIPRGCYHVAIPLNEPTLHLTVGVKMPRGMDVLRWMGERLQTTAMAASDLPNPASAADCLRYSAELRRLMLEGLGDDLVDQYLAETGSNLTPRPVFNLPWSATPDALPPGVDFTLALKIHSWAAIDAGDPQVAGAAWRCDGRRYHFPAAMRWVLEPLSGGTPIRFAHLVELTAGKLDVAAARLLVSMLVSQNLVELREASDTRR